MTSVLTYPYRRSAALFHDVITLWRSVVMRASSIVSATAARRGADSSKRVSDMRKNLSSRHGQFPQGCCSRRYLQSANSQLTLTIHCQTPQRVAGLMPFAAEVLDSQRRALAGGHQSAWPMLLRDQR